MFTLNDKIKDLTPYEPNENIYKIRLDANESFLKVPDYVMAEAYKQFGSLSLNRYPDPKAAKLCESFAKCYDLDPKNVAAGNGSDELISIIANSFLMADEKYAAFSYDFSMYDFYGHLAGAVGVKIPQNEGFSVDVDRVISVCKAENVRLLIFSNPCNPTSLGIDRENVRKIITSLENTLIVLDEAYMDFWDQSLLSEVSDYDNLIILRTCSKAFGLAALRIGFAVANERLINVIKAVKSPFNVNSISQLIAGTVLRHRGEFAAAQGQIALSLKTLQSGLEALNEKYGSPMVILKSCTNFVTVRYSESKELFEYLKSVGIAVRFFGSFLRITCGTKEENTQVLRFIEKYLAKDF